MTATGRTAITETAAQQASQKLATDTALAEFNALRAEITNRMTTVAALVGVGLTALGVIIGLVVQEHDDRLLLAVPPLAVAVNLVWSVENRQVGFIGEYIRTLLWPYLAKADAQLPSWEAEVAKRRGGRGNVLRSIGTDYAMPVIFAVVALVSLAVLGGSVETDGHPARVSNLRWIDWGLAVVALAVPFAMTPGNWWTAWKKTRTGAAAG